MMKMKSLLLSGLISMVSILLFGQQEILSRFGPFEVPSPENIIRSDIYSGQESDFTNENILISYFPVPSLVDIDGDSDLDLFVGSEFNSFIYMFENIGTASNPVFERVSNNQNPVYELCSGYPFCGNVSFVDFDDDGDFDVIGNSERVDGGQTIYYLVLYENIGTAQQPNFVLREGNENPYFNFDVGFRHSPTLIDLDSDNDFDLVVGGGNNGLNYYRNDGTNSNPQFQPIFGSQNPFLIVSSSDADGSIIKFADIDGDNDLDAMFTASVGSNLYNFGTYVFLENIGTSSNPQYEIVDESDSRFFCADLFSANIDVADLDGDGDFDIVAANSDGFFQFYENIGNSQTPEFERQLNEENPLYGGPTGNYDCGPNLSDWDNDGDLDLMIGKGNVHCGTPFSFYRNVGNSNNAIFHEEDISDIFNTDEFLTGEYFDTGDIDNDGDLDIISAGTWLWEIGVIENTGSVNSPEFSFDTEYNEDLFRDVYDVLSVYSLSLGDLDGDNDLDIVINDLDPTLRFIENVGTPSNPQFVVVPLQNDPFDGLVFDNGNDFQLTPHLVDLDQDGDLDLLCGGFNSSLNSEAFYIAENVGSPLNPEFVLRTGEDNPFSELLVNYVGTRPILADLDNDDDLDLLVGSSMGSLFFYENKVNTPTSVNSQKKVERNIKIYPTIVDDLITISFNEFDQHQSSISLISINGIQEHIGDYFVFGHDELSLSMSNIAAGYYYLKVTSNEYNYVLPFVKK
ncbi:MAG: FG-GAP-like repeat-containing protein [Saprospiraceae bacterium]